MFNTLSVLANAASNATSSIMPSANNSSSNEVDSSSDDSSNIHLSVVLIPMFLLSATIIISLCLCIDIMRHIKKDSCCTPSTNQSDTDYTPVPNPADLESGLDTNNSSTTSSPKAMAPMAIPGATVATAKIGQEEKQELPIPASLTP